jgi:hypothetical protein
LLQPTLSLCLELPKRPYTQFHLSANWGQCLYHGDEFITSISEYKRILASMVAVTTTNYFTAIIWLPFDQLSYVADLVHKEWGTKCDYYVWNKEGKFGTTGLWVSTCTEIALVCYYSSVRKRLPSHFTNRTDGKVMRNNWDFPAIANKSKYDDGHKKMVVNPTEMNVGVPMMAILNHTNPGEHVADWFCGTGSYSAAAICNGRHAVAVDIRQTQVYINLLFVCVFVTCH